LTAKSDGARGVTSQPPRLFVSTGLAAALNPLNSTMIAVALPLISTSFGVSSGALIHWLVTGYLVVTIVCQTPGGKMGDLWGYNVTLSIGRWLFVAGTVAAVFSPSLPPLVAGRLLMAAGGALLVPTTMALIRIHVPPERRPIAFGRMSAVMAAAAAAGPALGGVLIDAFGWQSVFLANLPILAVSWWLERGIKLARSRGAALDSRAPGFDWIGTGLLAAGLVTGLIGVRLPGTMTVGLLTAAVIFLGSFVFWERRVPEPVLDFRLFTRPRFAAGSLIVATQNLAMYALIFQMPFLFADLSDLPQSAVGLSMLALTAGMVVFAPLGGRVASVIGSRLTVVIGGLASMVGVALLTDLAIWQSASSVFVRLGLIGLGLGLSSGPTQAAAMGAVDSHESGMAAAAMSTTRYFGGIAGIAILSSLLPDVGAGEPITKHVTAFWIFGASYGISVFLALALPGKGEPSQF